MKRSKKYNRYTSEQIKDICMSYFNEIKEYLCPKDVCNSISLKFISHSNNSSKKDEVAFFRARDLTIYIYYKSIRNFRMYKILFLISHEIYHVIQYVDQSRYNSDIKYTDFIETQCNLSAIYFNSQIDSFKHDFTKCFNSLIDEIHDSGKNIPKPIMYKNGSKNLLSNILEPYMNFIPKKDIYKFIMDKEIKKFILVIDEEKSIEYEIINDDGFIFTNIKYFIEDIYKYKILYQTIFVNNSYLIAGSKDHIKKLIEEGAK